MEKFTAGYVNTSNNFVIANLTKQRNENGNYYPIYCVLKNILQRGCPTVMSEYLQERIGKLHLMGEFSKKILLIDNDIPKWKRVFKDEAIRKFYEKDILEYFKQKIEVDEYLRYNSEPLLFDISFAQKFILPELHEDGTVTFRLPLLNLNIHIIQEDNRTKENKEYFSNNYSEEFIYLYDKKSKLKHSLSSLFGRYYRENRASNIEDKEINLFIKLSELKENKNYLNYKMITLLKPLNRIIINKKFHNYRSLIYDAEFYEGSYFKKAILATAIIRFQILLIELLQREVLDIDSEVWNFNILSHDVENFAELAIEDTFIWLENLFKLNKIKFKRPKVNVRYCKDYSEFVFDEGYINIAFSVMKRWTDEYLDYPEVIYVRTDYFEEADYFKVCTTEPIKYNLNEKDENDVNTLRFFLRNIFGFEEFYPGQVPIIIDALARKDVIGLLPTGSGKSLCYQLAALLQPAISFVVSPLKSLMYDQKYNLDKFYITRTNYITSDLTYEEKAKIGEEFSNGKYLFIWISPERFQIQEFREYLNKLNREQHIALAVIDEVHCLSEWGHDFRTSYLNLIRTIRKYCPSASLLGLTATASSFVLEDLKAEFGIGSGNIRTLAKFTRPELKFFVHKDEVGNYELKKELLKNLIDKLNRERNIFELKGEQTQSGLVFTLFKNGQYGCYSLSKELRGIFGEDIRWYSGDIPEVKSFRRKTKVMDEKEFEEYKRKVQVDYKENRFPLLVATKAFGMGIDKPNIRYTIHFGLPASLEALYQEAGRAGRDKEPAECYVIYSKENIPKHELDELFNPNTSVERIGEIQKKYGFSGNDVLRIFFLWLGNNKGVNEEFRLMKFVFLGFARPRKVGLIDCRAVNISFSELQKVIYRLSLLKIVDDWTIENWTEGSEVIKVYFYDYNEEKVFKALVDYINKYDKEFSLDERYINNSKYGKYVGIYVDNSLDFYDKAFKILLEWIYDNIVYNRRQAIKNVMELCENFKDSDSFREELERYFRFTETSYILDHIAQNPTDYEVWFQVFYKPNGEFINKNDAEEIKGSLTRLLESYRYNTGLNFISGMIRLMLNDFENQDGRPRMESALEQIKTYDEKVQRAIFQRILKLKDLFKDEYSKVELSKILLSILPTEVERVYKELGDYYSLSIILEEQLNRLKRMKLKEVLYD